MVDVVNNPTLLNVNPEISYSHSVRFYTKKSFIILFALLGVHLFIFMKYIIQEDCH